VRTVVFQEAGGLDERLSDAYDDVDLGWRINLFGHRVRYAPTSQVHRRSPTATPDESFAHQSLLERNALIVLYKNLDQANLGGFLAGALGLAARRAVSTSGLPKSPTGKAVDAKRPERLAQQAIDSGALAGLYGIDGFVELIGELARDPASVEHLATIRAIRGAAEDRRRRLVEQVAMAEEFLDQLASLEVPR